MTETQPQITISNMNLGGRFFTGVQHMSFDRPTVICLGGIATTTPDIARDFAGVAEELLGGASLYRQACMYTVSYNDPILRSGKDEIDRLLREYYEKGRESTATRVADAVAAEMVSQHMADVLPAAEGDRQAAYAASECTLRNIIFFAYSLGSVALRHVHDHLHDLLRSKGWNERESTALMRNVKAVTIGEFAHERYPAAPWYFTSVHVRSGRDEVIKPLLGGKALEPLSIHRPDPASPMLLVDTQLPLSGYQWHDDEAFTKRWRKFLTEAKKQGEVSLEDKTQVVWPTEPSRYRPQTDHTGHEPKTYAGERFSEQPFARFVRTLVQSALRNCLRASLGKITVSDPADLLQPARLLPDKVTPQECRTDDVNTGYLGFAPGYDYRNRLQNLLAGPSSGAAIG